MPNTGTRALSYVYDDYAPTAKAIQGTALGNGNLMYTVSHDNASGKHSARFESYTSFNMPKSISATNIAAALDTTLAQAISHSGSATGTPSGLSHASADRSLAFIYGPEHQRTKQVVTFNNLSLPNLNDLVARNKFSPSTTWYLNGEDGQSLTYEKEIKTVYIKPSGSSANAAPIATQVTEHKHYLQVAGINVGMVTKREGAYVTATSPPPLVPVLQTGYSCPAGYIQTAATSSPNSGGCLSTATGNANLQTASLRYFHSDHLGSIIAITNEQGAVVERMAYDARGWSRTRLMHLRASIPAVRVKERRSACWREDSKTIHQRQRPKL
jgi:hypothetical protein